MATTSSPEGTNVEPQVAVTDPRLDFLSVVVQKSLRYDIVYYQFGFIGSKSFN